MQRRISLYLLLTFLLVGGAGFGWYLWNHRASADVAQDETTQSFEDAASIKGTEENPAELENVTVDDDGTIRPALAPAEQ